jgi:regulator of RNase E activity RraA
MPSGRPDLADLVARLERLDTCVVSDALDALGLPGPIAGIVPCWEGARLAGSVHTVLLRRLEEGERGVPGSHLGARAIEAAAPGEVIVVANAGRLDSGAWGGLLSAAAKVRGIGGVVIDGACRDVDETIALGLPVFARGVIPISARGRTIEEATDVPAHVGGVVVTSGDLVIADRSGVVVIGAGAALEVLDVAADLVAREKEMLAEIERGVPVGSVLDGRYESMLASTPHGVEGGSEAPGSRGGARARE